MSARPQDTQHNTPGTTPRGSLPQFSEWRVTHAGQSQPAKRAAVRELLPLLAVEPPFVVDQWVSGLVDMGAYRDGGRWLRRQLADLVAFEQAAPTATAEQAPADEDQADEAADVDAPLTEVIEPEPASDGMLPVPGTKDDWAYLPSVGVWWKTRQVLPWCPVVTRLLVTRDAGGASAEVRMTIAVGTDTVTVAMDEVSDGSAWNTRFPGAIGWAGRDVRDVLAAIVRDQAARLPETPTKPRWDGDRLILPPSDALTTAGYFEQAGEWREWCHLVRRTMDAPKIALMLSLTMAGVFVSPTDPDLSMIVHANGNSSEGKGTAIKVCASAFGNPRKLVRPWGSTPKGVLSYLRETDFLSAFRDELGGNARLTRSDELEELVLTLAEGAERDMSTRTGRYRTPSGEWRGCLISTGNLSIVSRVSNVALMARVIEVDTPLTANGAQSHALKDLAGQHYGHAIHRLSRADLTPGEFAERARKFVTALKLPDNNGVIERYGQRLALGCAGAWLLENLCGVTGYSALVLELAKEMLVHQQTVLREHGQRPYDQLWDAVAEAAMRAPDKFPARGKYIEDQLKGLRVEVSGWDISGDDRISADIAVLPGELRSIANAAGITDWRVALRDGDQRKMLVSNKRGELKYNLAVGPKRTGTYALRKVETEGPETEVPGDNGPDTPLSSGSVPGQVPADDQASYGSSGLRGEGVCKGDLAECSDADLAALAEGGVPPWRELAAELLTERAAMAPSVITERPEPTPATRTAEQAPKAVSGPARGAKSAAPKGRSDQRSGNPQVKPDSDEIEHWQAWLNRAEITADDETARRALLAFKASTGGLRWSEYPGRTGVNAYKRLQAQHSNMPEIQPVKSALANSITADGNLVLLLDYVDQTTIPEMGQWVTTIDITCQFLAAARAVVLGDGEPVEIGGGNREMRGWESLLKVPGYLELAKPVAVDHPAFATRDLSAGRWLPIPLVRYLHEWGAELHFSRGLVWEKYGQRLTAHSAVFNKAIQWLLQWHDKPEYNEPARIAETAVKAVYASTYGGMLRSERFNRDYVQRNWSDQLISLAWVNAFRNLDRVSYGVPPVHKDGGRSPYRDVLAARDSGMQVRPLGMCKDTAFLLSDSAEPFIPAGVDLSEKLPGKWKPGKWKLEKHVEVTGDVIRSIEVGSAYSLRDAVNAAWRDNADISEWDLIANEEGDQ